MRKIGVFLIISAILCVGLILSRKVPLPIQADETESLQAVKAVVNPSIVYGEVKEDTALFSNPELTGAVGILKKGGVVEILEDRSETAYRVRDSISGQNGWVTGGALSIEKEGPVNQTPLTEEQILLYAKAMQFSSETPYFVWVDIERQKIYCLKQEEGAWQFVREIVCATGKNKTPTLRGLFTIGERGEWFYSKRLGSGAKYWVRYQGTYLFHSVAMDEKQNVIDGVLGQKRSSGCVRMSVEDAKWFYETVPEKTTVFIH